MDRLVLPRRIGLTSIGYIEYVKRKTPLFEEVRDHTCRPKVCIGIADFISRYRASIEGSIDISDTFAETLQNLSEVSSTGSLHLRKSI
uniref:Uncharacterized protein n=1 Tax=Ignisphaera aggregans TaxID=334771 RepID=A0A7J3QEL4_9CREN